MGPVGGATAASPRGRQAGLDSLRIGVTALVVFHHAAITYGASGDWYWHERPAGSSPLLTLFVVMNQAWFMGFFFLLAGYFTPPAYARRGSVAFLRGRLARLGLPLLAYAVVLDPLTNAVARWHDVVPGWVGRIERGEMHPGPMWFAEALLAFSLLYVVWRVATRTVVRPAGRLPSDRALLVAACCVGAVAFAVRLLFPTDRAVGGLLPAYFPGYVALFAAGVAASGRELLVHVPARQAARWLAVSVVAVTLLVLSTRLPGPSSYSGGWSIKAFILAFYEPFFAFGIILALLWLATNRLDHAGPVHDWLARRAFSVYLTHPPVLVAVARVLQSWGAAPVWKTAVAGGLATALCFLAGSILLSVPGVRRVL